MPIITEGGVADDKRNAATLYHCLRGGPALLGEGDSRKCYIDELSLKNVCDCMNLKLVHEMSMESTNPKQDSGDDHSQIIELTRQFFLQSLSSSRQSKLNFELRPISGNGILIINFRLNFKNTYKVFIFNI